VLDQAKDLRRKKMRLQQQQKGNKLGFTAETVISKPQNQDPTNGSSLLLCWPVPASPSVFFFFFWFDVSVDVSHACACVGVQA
jgi:hypothetical protein